MTSYVLDALDRLKRRLPTLRDRGPSLSEMPGPMPELRARPMIVQTPSGPKIIPADVKLHHVIPADLGHIGEHLVWTVIKAIQRGDDVLVIANSYDGKDTLRLTLPARKVA